MNTSAAGAPSRPPKAVRPPKARKAAAAKKPRFVNTPGPVEDLQSYVKADWWRHLFNANYLRTDGDVVDDQTLTDREITEVTALLRPPPEAQILDLCCGQGRHALAFARRGFVNITGLDRSHYLVTRARSAAKREELDIVFREGDARKLPFPTDTFDFVLILGNSFGYFESLQDDETVLREVFRVLKPYGRVLLDLTDGDFMRKWFQPRSWEWIDHNYFVCRERTLSDDQTRLISREVITHTRKGVVSDQFYAERLYSAGQMRRLLRETGFMQVDAREPFTTESKRNQDLGMMSQRILYTARPKKIRPAPGTAGAALRKVAVIMGDPRKKDAVKPNGAFDHDDFATIGSLRKALGQLEGYRFSFFDNHDTLLADARRIRAEHDLVFNLCDEGFDNRARRELHVPALLEMVGVPYTGGTPQCLAFCYDKSLVRGIAKELDIPVPEAFVISSDEPCFHELTIPFPVIVKPNLGDSSMGITRRCVCSDIRELEQAIVEIRDRFGYRQPVLVEHFLCGKDLTVGFVGNPPDTLHAFPVIEEDYSQLPSELPRICGYEAKWDPESPYWNLRSIPAELPEVTEGFLVASCQRLFERLECQDYARFDWRLDERGTPRLLEVNPNPGWCWDGHLAKMAKMDGCDYPELLHRILDAAFRRICP